MLFSKLSKKTTIELRCVSDKSAQKASDMLVVMTTMPNSKSAQKMASDLVGKKLAACVSILEKVTSIYYWKGKVEKSREVLLLIKIRNAHWKATQKFMLSQHPYELPELVALPVTHGSKKYLDWIEPKNCIRIAEVATTS